MSRRYPRHQAVDAHRRRYPFTYVVLRYVHDPVCGETLNIGVLVHSRDADYVAVLFASSDRLKAAFHDFRDDDHQRVIESFRTAVNSCQATQLSDAAAVAVSIWPDGGLSYRFRGAHVGLAAADLDSTTRDLFARFVGRHHAPMTSADVTGAFARWTPPARCGCPLHGSRCTAPVDHLGRCTRCHNGACMRMRS